jgi:hypothetical protein
MGKKEGANWMCRFKLSKYREDIEAYRNREEEFHRLFEPYEVVEGEKNVLLNSGIDEIWDLVTGASSDYFNNANSQIGVGDSTTAASATQTDLQATTNKTYKGMESSYPTTNPQKVTFKSSFGSGEANYAWNEWVVKNDSSEVCLNRKVESLGTKSGGTWTLEVDITLS